MPPPRPRSERPSLGVPVVLWSGLGLLVAVGAAAATYRSIVHAYFYADDFLHLYQLNNWPLSSFVFQTHGGHGFLVRNLVFWATFEAVGPRSDLFFWSVLLTHLAAVGLFFAVVVRATGSVAVACLGAVLWGTCPMNAGTLGWYSVFGQVLAAVFALLAVLGLLGARTDPAGMSPARIGVCGLLLLGAASCFGVGLVVVGIAPLLVWLLAPPRGLSRRAWLVAILIPLVGLAIYLGQLQAEGTFEDVTPDGLVRLSLLDVGYTARVLANLVAVGTAALLRGPWRALVPWPTTGSIAVVAAAAVLVLGAVLVGDRAGRRLLAALGLVVAGAYGAVAVARAPFFVGLGLTPATAAQTPRYHYFAQAGIGLGLSIAFAMVARRFFPRAGGAVALLALAIVLGAERGRPLPIDRHAAARMAVAMFFGEVRRAVAAAAPGATVRLRNRTVNALSLIEPPWRFPGTSGLFTIFYPENEVEGRRLVFEAQGPAVLRARERGGRIATLLVPPAARPGGAR